MEALVASLGFLLALFLVLAATIEAILESLRGALERFGVTWLKGKTSLEDALKLAAEVAPSTGYLATKLAAVETAASQVKGLVEAKADEIKILKESLEKAAGAQVSDALSASLNNLAASVKESIEADERRRIWVLKGIAALLGFAVAWIADFHVFQILASSADATKFFGGLSGLQDPWLNRIVGGVAAAAGSNYWHDQLDRVRAVKTSFSNARKLAGG